MTIKYCALPADYEIGNARRELDSLKEWAGEVGKIASELESTIDHCSEEEAMSIMLDWAMQIREKEELSWAECIRAATVFYFG